MTWGVGRCFPPGRQLQTACGMNLACARIHLIASGDVTRDEATKPHQRDAPRMPTCNRLPDTRTRPVIPSPAMTLARVNVEGCKDCLLRSLCLSGVYRLAESRSGLRKFPYEIAETIRCGRALAAVR